MRAVTAGLLFVGLVIAGPSEAPAEVLVPAVNATLTDDPMDGIADRLNVDEYHDGILARSVERNKQTRVVSEFDLSAYAGRSLSGAALDFQIAPDYEFGEGESPGPQFRAFDLYLYPGDGSAQLGDFSTPGDRYVDTVALESLTQIASFTVDLLEPVQEILPQTPFVGVRVVPLGAENYPSIFLNPTLAVAAGPPSEVPELSSLVMLGVAALGPVVLGRRRRRP